MRVLVQIAVIIGAKESAETVVINVTAGRDETGDRRDSM